MILIFTLIAIALLLIASVALVRSFDSSLTLAGNMAFKRDLVNQAERGLAQARDALSTGGPLVLDSTRNADNPANNYWARPLESNARGLPKVLIDETAWAASGMTTNADIEDKKTGIKVRYVIDRMCNSIGPSTPANCATYSLGLDTSGTIPIVRAGGNLLPVYRISVRVTGLRNTQTYIQSTLSM